MSVSGVSSGGSTAVHHHRHSRRSQASAGDDQSTTSSSSTSATGQSQDAPPAGPPGGQGGPGGPGGPGGKGGGELSKFEDILKNGGGVDDLKAEADKQFDAFKSSDKFKSLSADEQQKIQDRHDSGDEDKRLQGLVDRFKQTGSLKPPEGEEGGGRGKLFAELQQRGQSRQAEVYSKFGVGGFGGSDSSSADADGSADATSTVAA